MVYLYCKVNHNSCSLFEILVCMDITYIVYSESQYFHAPTAHNLWKSGLCYKNKKGEENEMVSKIYKLKKNV